MSTIVTILGVSLLIILHELGHYLVALACGMRVQKFSIGFGVPLVSRKVRGTVWQLAAIPLGGYVQIQGMGPAEEGEDTSDPHSFRNRPGWQRALVIAAGPAMNWLLAALFIAALAGTVGFTRSDETQARLGKVLEGGPAHRAGLASGDRVLSVNGVAVSDWPSLVQQIRAHPGADVSLVVEREGRALPLVVTLDSQGEGEQRYGVMQVLPSTQTQRFGPLGALAAGIREANTYTTRQVALLWGMLTGTQGGRLSGIPGIVRSLTAQAKEGAQQFVESLAWLSIGLFLLNLLPIPALDGSRLAFLGIELVRRRPVDERIEGIVHAVGFILLLGLMIFVSVRDLL